MTSLALDERVATRLNPHTVGAPEVGRHGSIGSSVLRGALAMLKTQPLTWGATLLGTVAAPTLLGADVLGQVTVVNTVAALGSTVAGLGVSEYLVRRVAQRPETMLHDLGIAHLLQFLTSLLGVVIIAWLGASVAASQVNYPLLLIALMSMLVTPARTVLLSAFRGREQLNSYSWLNAATQVFSTVGSLLVLACGGNVVESMATGAVLVTLTTLVAWRLSGIRSTRPRVDRAIIAEFAQFARGGLPFVSWQIAQMAYSQIDRLLLGAMAASSELGWYAAANRIATIPIFIPTMIITPLFPALSRSLQQPQELRRGVAQTLRYTLFLTAPLAAGTIALAPAIPPLLGWPADFANSVRPMQILALQLPLISSGMVLGATLMAVGRERRMVGLATVATALNVALNLVAIPASQHVFGSGAIGAAVVSVVSETVMLIGAIAFLPTGLLDPGVLWVAIRITSAGVAVAVVASACLSVAGMMASVAAGATTYVALTVPMRILGIEDVRLLTSRFLRRPG